MPVTMLTVVDLDKLSIPRRINTECAFRGGSREMVSPPPTDTDLDIVIHVRDVQNAVYILEGCGFDATKGKYVDEHCNFTTLRKGELNVMLVGDPYEFGAMWGATSYAKSVNMKDKADRYDLFERVRLPWRNNNVSDL